MLERQTESGWEFPLMSPGPTRLPPAARRNSPALDIDMHVAKIVTTTKQVPDRNEATARRAVGEGVSSRDSIRRGGQVGRREVG